MSVSWLVVDQKGKAHRGTGPQSGLGALLEDAQAACLVHSSPPMLPVLVAGGARLSYEVERIIDQSGERRWWSLQGLAPDTRLWLWPDGSRMVLAPALGNSAQSLAAAEEALEIIKRACGGPDH